MCPLVDITCQITPDNSLITQIQVNSKTMFFFNYSLKIQGHPSSFATLYQDHKLKSLQSCNSNAYCYVNMKQRVMQVPYILNLTDLSLIFLTEPFIFGPYGLPYHFRYAEVNCGANMDVYRSAVILSISYIVSSHLICLLRQFVGTK